MNQPAPPATAGVPAAGDASFHVSRIMIGGFLVIAAFFGGFGAWAAFAPLDSAAIAPGIVAVDSRRKTVQHFEGGIISRILVTEGSRVEAGQDVIVLDKTRARAELGLLKTQFDAAQALRSRLIAERDKLPEIRFPPSLLATADAEARAARSTQNRIFSARSDSLNNQTAIYIQRIAQLNEEITGLKDEIREHNRQLGYIEDELVGLRDLVKRGYERKPRLLALEREKSEVAGKKAQNRARIARAGQSIGETRLQITELANARLKEVVEESRKVESEISDLKQRISAASDVFARTSVKAPVAGTVVNLQVFTSGGVISPGQPLMDIVPRGDKLVILARVEPTDIDIVHADLPAKVRLTAFTQSATEIFDGKVVQVSADRLVDERSGAPYYEARVVLDANQPDLEKLALQPGMPAEVMIVTGTRTPFDYLIKPLMNSFGRAFKEE